MNAVSQVFITKAIDYALRFVASVLIARFLGPADKGVLTFAMLVVVWTVSFGNLSLVDAIVYLVGKREFSPAQATATAVLFSLAAGGLYVLALFALVSSSLFRWPVGELGLFYVLLSLIPLNLLLTNLTGILQGLSVFKAYNFFSVLRSLALLVAVLLAVWLAEDRLRGVAYATIVASALNAALLLGYLGRLAHWQLRFSLDFLKKAFHYGLRGHVSVVLATITMRFDQFVLGALLNPIHLGLYSVAVSISELAQMLPDSIGVVLFPKLAGDQAAAGAVTARVCRLTVLLMFLAAVAVAAVAGPMVRIVYGEAFRDAAKPLLFLAPSIVFLSISKVLTKYIYGVGRPQLCVWSTAAAALVTGAMIFPMVRNYGAVGAAITSSAAYAVGAMADLVIVMRLSTRKASDFLVLQKVDLQWARP